MNKITTQLSITDYIADSNDTSSEFELFVRSWLPGRVGCLFEYHAKPSVLQCLNWALGDKKSIVCNHCEKVTHD